VNLIVAYAAHAADLVRHVPPANVAPVSVAKSIEILNPHGYDILDGGVYSRTVANNDSVNGLFPLHQNGFSYERLIVKPVPQLFKPIISLFQSIITIKNPAALSHMHGWRFPIVEIINLRGQTTVWRSKLRWINLSREDIRSLIAMEEIAGKINLGRHKAGVDEYQYNGEFRPKKLFAMGGCILCALGLVLVFKVLDYVYLDTRFNVNMALGVLFLGAISFWIGGALIFHVFGLLT
jgi:hypothetical protein